VVNVLLSESQATMVTWGGAAAIVVLAWIGVAVLVRKAPDWGGTRPLAVVLGLIGVAALAAPITKWGAGTRVLVVRGTSPADIHVEHQRLFGSASFRFTSGASASLERGVRTLVVNDLPLPIKLERVTYGTAPHPELVNQIAPYQIERIDEIVRYLGPDHPPPDKSRSQSELWLQW
jgi:hypothetical protein